MLTLKLKSDKKELKKLLKNIKSKDKLQVGIINAGKAVDSDLTVATIGAIHEFGSATRGIPERSFIRETLFTKQKDIQTMVSKQAGKAIEDEQPLNKTLGIIGEFTKGLIQESFTNNNWQSLKQSTIDAKGSSKPLIDTGQLRQSITWKVL